jgi:outer membrane protein assembly factor BamB
LFIGSCAATFYAIDKSTGQVQWTYYIRRDGKQRNFRGNPLITRDLILIGTDYGCEPDAAGHVYAFERATGKVIWKYRSTGIPTDILQLGSNAYFGSFQDEWSSVDVKKGRLNWSFSTGASNEGCSAIKSPVASKDRLFLIGLDGVVYALDAQTGRVKWKRILPAPPTTALTLRDETLYLGTAAQQIYGLNTKTGSIMKELALEATPVGRLALDSNSIYMFLEDRSERAGFVVSVDPNLAGIRWKRRLSPDWVSERPHVWKGLIIAGNCRGELAAFRASDGAQQWTLDLTGCIRSIGSSGNMLFVGVQEGMVYAFDLSASGQR